MSQDMIDRSASYEAVNWKERSATVAIIENGVSLVWGCELKGKSESAGSSTKTVSLVWGCELKDHISEWRFLRKWSASYEAVNWKVKHSAV